MREMWTKGGGGGRDEGRRQRKREELKKGRLEEWKGEEEKDI